MGKKLKKIIYGSKRLGGNLLTEVVESFLYLLWWSSTPMSVKLLTTCWEDEFRRQTIRARLERLYRRGFLFKMKKKGGILFRGRKSLGSIIWNNLEIIRRKKSNEKWDGLWRILIYDIPERIRGKRDSLRIFIKELGFAQLQESCWISPYDFSQLLYDFCKRADILEYINIYEGKLFSGKDIDRLVNNLWNLEELNKNYRYLIKLCEKNEEIVEIQEMDLKKYYLLYFQPYKLFRDNLRKDPFLPKEFLKGWLRGKAQDKLNRLSKKILKKFSLKL